MMPKRNLLSLILLSVFLLSGKVAYSVEPNTLTESEKRSGWKLLFDGKTKEGWRNYKKDSISDGWKVVKGALVRAQKGAGDIITENQYDSFVLTLEFKISKGGNSGIMYHVTEEAAQPWHTGPEFQVQDNVAGHDPQKAGWLYQLYPAKIDSTKPVGQWNQVRIVITPELCEHYMNGLKYCTYVKGSDDWDQKVAKSKFSKYENFGKPTKGHICLQDHNDVVSYRNIKIREIKGSKNDVNPVDGVTGVKSEIAYPEMKWAGWEPIDDKGKSVPLRPIVLTHANDQSGRTFVATQRGVIHVFPKDLTTGSTEIYLDMSDKVSYSDKQNEEGFLGMAFHPDYKNTGEFFAYYSSSTKPHTSIVSRFRVSNDANKADPEFEEVLMEIPEPYWNHNGGTIAFGPDGYLYIALGDGGSGNDPHGNGQNLKTILGKILCIDVDKKDAGKNYAIPKSNPYAGNGKGYPEEIWASGIRNIWQISFDSKTGQMWFGEVGQALWEEINLGVKGGNYGWSQKEGTKPFGDKALPKNHDFIEPIWEYDHDVGKSITGGLVYRGSKIPSLAGSYVYADYVSGRIWALNYDVENKKLISNKSIDGEGLPIISFGADEDNEIYYLVVKPDGKGIYKLSE